METEWDYTQLADAYLKRPDYAPSALQELFWIAGLQPGDTVCDIGAGVAHLTLPLAAFGCKVDAVEPNDAMRANGQKRTVHLPLVHWSEGTGEATGRSSGAYDFVTFGSSFNACDRGKALAETHRLLKPGKFDLGQMVMTPGAQEAMAIADLTERTRFLNRGQGWVVRKLRELLPSVEDANLRDDLVEMLEAHETNIARAEAMLPQ